MRHNAHSFTAENVGDKYSQLWCFEQCLLGRVLAHVYFHVHTAGDAERKCGCTLAGGSHHSGLPFCTAKMFVRCFWPFIKVRQSLTDCYWMPGLMQVANETKCKTDCKPPCHYMNFASSVSYATFPSPETKFFLDNTTLTMKQLESTIILEVMIDVLVCATCAQVFYERLEYTTIRHVVAMSWDNFIAQIGGQVSLWVGGSIITGKPAEHVLLAQHDCGQ
jgi:hypothetical protein